MNKLKGGMFFVSIVLFLTGFSVLSLGHPGQIDGHLASDIVVAIGFMTILMAFLLWRRVESAFGNYLVWLAGYLVAGGFVYLLGAGPIPAAGWIVLNALLFGLLGLYVRSLSRRFRAATARHP